MNRCLNHGLNGLMDDSDFLSDQGNPEISKISDSDRNGLMDDSDSLSNRRDSEINKITDSDS